RIVAIAPSESDETAKSLVDAASVDRGGTPPGVLAVCAGGGPRVVRRLCDDGPGRPPFRLGAARDLGRRSPLRQQAIGRRAGRPPPVFRSHMLAAFVHTAARAGATGPGTGRALGLHHVLRSRGPT